MAAALSLALAPLLSNSAVSSPSKVVPTQAADLESWAAALELAAVDLVDLSLPDDASGAFVLPIDLEGRSLALELHPHSLRADGFVLYVQGPDGQLDLQPAPAPGTLRGTIVGRAGSRVSASLTPRGLVAQVIDPVWGTYAVQPLADVELSAPRSMHLVHHESAILDGGHGCGTPDGPLVELGASPKSSPGDDICDIAVDADVEYYQKNQSSVANTLADMESILNSVSGIYESDVQVTYQLTVAVVRTISDNYSSNVAGTRLDQFLNHWNSQMASVKRDVAHLFTGVNLQGSTIGVAYLGVICNTTQAYGLSESKYGGGFSGRVALTAHELGHNFNANHCNALPQCQIMCSGVGGCGSISSFAPSPANVIRSFASTRTCLLTEPNPIAPPFEEIWSSTVLDGTKWTHNKTCLISQAGTSEPSLPYTLNLDSAGPDLVTEQDEIRSGKILLGGEPEGFLSYWSQHVGVEFGEGLVADYQNSSGTWVEVHRVVSNGVDQGQFENHVVPLPGAALHNGFRLRLRVEGDENDDDWFVDDIRVSTTEPCPPVVAYCTGKLNSDGCVSSVRGLGTPSATDPTPFVVEGISVLAGKPGIFFYGFAPFALPFQDGFLCVQPPTQRFPVQVSSSSPFPCNGVFSIDFNAHIQGGSDPALVEGTKVYGQWWFRDNAVASTTGLTDGLEFEICP